MVVLTKVTHEYLLAFRSTEFTVLMLIRESFESLVAQDVTGSEYQADDAVIETGRRRECLGFEVTGNTSLRRRVACHAVGTRDGVTQQIEDEGVAKFNEPFDTLMKTLAHRSRSHLTNQS